MSMLLPSCLQFSVSFTVEIDRPIRIVIRPQDLLGELPEILAAMKSKGLKP